METSQYISSYQRMLFILERVFGIGVDVGIAISIGISIGIGIDIEIDAGMGVGIGVGVRIGICDLVMMPKKLRQLWRAADCPCMIKR